MKLTMKTGHPVMNNERVIEGDSIRFVTEDGRDMFEVAIGSDGSSLEVRAVDACKVDGELHAGVLEIRPKVANAVVLRTPRYNEA
jgi:hypothetical protein